MGVDSSRIDVVAEPARSAEATGQVDRATLTRPAGRAALGAAVGLIAGLLLGWLLFAVSDLPAGIILATAIAGVALGALFAMYSRLPVSTDVVDVETGQNSYVKVDVSDMDGEEISNVERLVIRT